MKKLLALLLSIVLCLNLAACTAQREKKDIVILYTNDVHTYINEPLSYDVIAGLKTVLKEKYGNVLLVDAGDAVQGAAYGSMDKGATIIELMNAAGYDVATLGNHEFDYGMDGCMNILKWAKYPYISCNFYHEKDGVKGKTVLDSTKVFEVGGRRIAFVGITTPESFSKSTPAYFQDGFGNYIYGIAGGADGSELYAAVQAAIDSVDADFVIGLGHLGDDLSSGPWTSEKTIANTTGLDAFIDGHSHSTVEGKTVADKNGMPVLLTQTGEYLNAIGMMLIDGETGEISTDLIRVTPVLETFESEIEIVTKVVGYEFEAAFDLGTVWCADDRVTAIKNNWIAEIDKKLGQVIGKTDIILDNYDAEGNRLVRSQETNTGDFSADALYYLFDSMGLDVDVAIMNGGGIRNKAVSGALTYKTAKDIHTFGNVACLQTVTGQQLLDALEWGSRGVGSGIENGSFLQVAGITYEINSQWPSSVQQDDKEVWIGAPTGGYRVQNVQVYNRKTGEYEALDLNAYYNLAGYNYTLRDLGGGFNMFQSAVNVLDYVMEDYMVLAYYIQAFPDGMVKAGNSPLLDKYPNMLLDYESVNGSGRITIK